MIINLGKKKPGSTFEVPFHTFDSNDPSASVIISAFVVGDIAIYKDGGTTERASTSGYTLLDTDGINFDGIVGVHGFSIDLSDNTTANFFEAGSRYLIRIGPITVDAATINFWPAMFEIGYDGAILDSTIATLASQTSFTLEEGPADDDALNGMPCVIHDLASAVQIAKGIISDYIGSTKTITLDVDPGIFTMAIGDNFSVFIGDALTSAAQANLQDMYDGTGYVAESAPASRAQVDGIGAASGGAFPIQVGEDNASTAIKGVSSVGTETGTFANIEADDGVYHVLTHVANDIDWIYGFDILGSRTAVRVRFKGFLNGNNDDMLLQAYDFVGTDWETVKQIPGQNGSTDIELTADLLSKHTGTGVDLGKVYIRYQADGAMTSPVMNTNLLHVDAVNIGTSVGYANGQIWVDTLNGVAGVEKDTNGVADNKCLLWVDAVTLSGPTVVNTTDFHIINGSTILLTGVSDNYSLFGDNWILQQGSRSVAGAYFQGAHVSGISTSASEVHYEGCDVATMSVQLGHFDFCSFDGTVTMTLAGDYNYHNCYSKVAGAGGPTFTKTAGQTITAQWRNFAGSGTFSGIQAGDVYTISGTELGDIVLNGADGTVKILGVYESLTDNRAGTPTLIEGAYEGSDITDILADTDELQLILSAGIAARANNATLETLLGVDDDAAEDTLVFQVWEEILTAALHNNATSAGRRLRELSTMIIRGDTAQGAGTGNNQIQLDAGASAMDGAYDPALISIVGGTGAGQSRLIYQYDGTTKTATVDRSWKVNPDATSEFIIFGNPGREHVNEGLAQAGGASTITLNTLGSSIDDAYVGQMVFIRSGTGEDQARLVTGYDGTTKVATVDRPWGTVPDTTSGYAMLPVSPVLLATAAQASIDNLELGLIFGTAQTGTLSITQCTSDLTGYTDDQLIGRVIIFTSGPADGEGTDITDYASASGLLTFTALTLAPENGNTFKIV